MKKFCLLSVTCVICLGFQYFKPGPGLETGTAAAQWRPVGPDGGNILSLATNPQNAGELYAVTQGSPSHVYRSNDSGQNWTRIAFLSTLNDIILNPSNPDVIYALSQYGIFKSTDKGVSWKETRFGDNSYASGNMAVNPQSPGVLYAAGQHVYDTGSWKSCIAVYKSTDGGENWKVVKVNPVYSYGSANTLAISTSDPNTLYLSGAEYDGIDYKYKIFKSSDGGENWRDSTGTVGTSNYIYSLAVDPATPQKVYAGTSWGIFRSSDGGQNWEKNSGTAFAYALAIDPSISSTLYAGYVDRCYKSVDGGANWTAYSGASGVCNRLAVFSGQVFYASNAGIFRSSDGGSSWTESHAGIRATEVTALSYAPSSLHILFAEIQGTGLFKSTNYGESWQKLPYFYRCDSIKRIAINPSNCNDIFILAGG